ncbi:hypothetical protein BH10PSE14_BH10PSE14_23610 [soil metagenome]
MLAAAFAVESGTTLALAPIVGTYLCLSAVGLLRHSEAEAFLADLRAHPGAMHGVGAVAFFCGAGLLSLHRYWASPPEIALGAVAAWWLFEGAGLLASPALLRGVFEHRDAARRLRATNCLSIGVGIYLMLIGMFGHVR